MKDNGWPTDLPSLQECAKRMLEFCGSVKAAEHSTGLTRKLLLTALKPAKANQSTVRCQEALADKLVSLHRLNKNWLRTGKGSKHPMVCLGMDKAEDAFLDEHSGWKGSVH